MVDESCNRVLQTVSALLDDLSRASASYEIHELVVLSNDILKSVREVVLAFEHAVHK